MSALVNVWVVVGEGNAGKSTLIRALTGARDQALFDIAAAASGFIPNTFIMPTSLQEFGVMPTDFIARVVGNYGQVKGAGAIQPHEYPWGPPPMDNVLLSLRETPMNGCPSAGDYLTAFSSAGWHIQAPIINLAMGGSTYRAPPHITLDVPGGAGVPANRKASAVRAAWGWL